MINKKLLSNLSWYKLTIPKNNLLVEDLQRHILKLEKQGNPLTNCIIFAPQILNKHSSHNFSYNFDTANILFLSKEAWDLVSSELPECEATLSELPKISSLALIYPKTL